MSRCLGTVIRIAAVRIAASCLWLVLACGLACGLAGEAAAHRRTAEQNSPGLRIPALTHGQMAVMADYRSRIVDLAARQTRTDETFRRLLNFVHLQYAACVWGWLPGSVTDETSPFNECSHAYLSATRALLLHMRSMDGDRSAVGSLIDRIDRDMLENSTALVLCLYSDESFNTADLIDPHWADVPFHGPSLGALLALVAGLAIGIGILAWSTRPMPRRAPATPNAFR
ncbi:hypothetical protein J2848_004447 [Azospirillum lipoferum]|uniref:DUF2937 family protein n=1 Tax=Azospirillum lipoferum TaxID=193 RepID=A0A5A9GKM9_AZOLI|nr:MULTISPECIES: hypothetical protein [Azospirillum]KAA0594913.1 hypothetical protein FZ942_19105 [Azospirillum lipoferum]MCP1612755.1 hypothetical protein [Azospirillum lipoferum]MDW5532106.1 hypothetical protein [Azospirillum sp. NL1]